MEKAQVPDKFNVSTITNCSLGRQFNAKSFVFKDNLYNYAISSFNQGYRSDDSVPEKDIFMLNFGKNNQFDCMTLKLKDTMEWKKFQQEEDYFANGDLRGSIYKEHLIIFRKKDYDYERQCYCEMISFVVGILVFNVSFAYFLPL